MGRDLGGRDGTRPKVAADEGVAPASVFAVSGDDLRMATGVAPRVDLELIRQHELLQLLPSPLQLVVDSLVDWMSHALLPMEEAARAVFPLPAAQDLAAPSTSKVWLRTESVI